jgi:tetratricopeptide (TPR) repeat protein
MRTLLATCALLLLWVSTPLYGQPKKVDRPIHGLGHVHMDISCAPAVSGVFDRALALLHNFWYARALEAFTEVAQQDPQCAMAYWGAAMTYNHPFWDAPTKAEETAAWEAVQKGMRTTRRSSRETTYLAAVAALYKDGGAGSKSARDQAYADAMAAAYAAYPDDETKLFYGLALLGTVKEGTKGFERQGLAAKLFEEVYAKNPQHPGVLHYLIHVYDDPSHAADGLKAARAYAAAAPAVPHAQHMPSHIFTRLGYWAESAATNENAWRTSEADVKRAGESGAYRDFHALNYLQYAYLQLGRFGDAKRVTGIIEAQYAALSNKTTAPDTPDLQARHVRGRTIYALPDRVAYGYFDMRTRLIVETGDWSGVAAVPLVAPSRDFRAMKLQLEAMAAARRRDPRAAKAAADEVERLAGETGQHPLAQTIITLQAKEAQAVVAHAAGDESRVIELMTEAVAMEDAIEALSQPPYPIIPAHELYGSLLMEMKRPAEATKHFAETLRRTPGRPMAVYGLARAAEALGDSETARARYTEFLDLWKGADTDRPELAAARRYLTAVKVAPVRPR